MEIKYYGKKDPLPLGRVMHAGNVNVVYEDGNLRYITCNGDEIIRKIYPAVRGQGWVTAIPAISEEIVEVKADSFYISYHCRYR